jgi:hypothetical protein
MSSNVGIPAVPASESPSGRAIRPLVTYVAAATSAPNAGCPRSAILDFRMQSQTQINWCWAAVAASIGDFYDQSMKWTECVVANMFLNLTCCCGEGFGSIVPSECNVPAHLSHVLPNVCFTKRLAHAVPIELCQRQICDGYPIGAHITWHGGSVDFGHFVVITGYDLDANTLVVQDPGPSLDRAEVDYDVCLTNYLAVGAWDRTYYTRP